MALGGVVQECGREHVRIIVTGRQEPLGDVERVPPIRDGHRREEGEGRGRQGTLNEGLLDRIDPGANVRDQLPDPMHR